MAIETYQPKIGVQPRGQGISEFSTNLPSPDMSGIKHFANAMSDIGETMMKDAAKQEAENAANSIQIVKNEDGTYERIAAPDSYGPYARNIFNAAVDQNYINTVYRDTESKLNEIASKRTTPPEARIAEMDAHITGVLKSIDPRYVGALGPILGRERNQRQGSILNLAQAQSIATLENSLLTGTKASMDQFINAVSVGNEVDAKIAEQNIIDSTRSRIALSTQDQSVIEAEVKKVQDSIKGMRYLAPVLDRVRQGIAAGTLMPEELGLFTQMMTAGLAPAGSTAFGITDQDLMSNVNETALKEMRPVFEQMHKNYIQNFKESEKERKATELYTLLTGSNIGFLPADRDDSDLYNAATKLVGPDIYNPQAIRDIGYSFNGLMPKEAYGNYFKDAYKINPSTPSGLATLQKQLYAYETLQSVTTKSGSVKDMTDMVNNTDRNFFRLVLAGTKNGKSVETAVLGAQAAIKDGLAMDEGKRRSMVFGKYQETKNAQPTESLVLDTVTGNMVGGVQSSSLPERARSNILESMALSISQGIDYDTAAKDAALEFQRNWTKSTAVISHEGGISQDWVPKTSQPPQVQDPVSHETTDAYLDGYIAKIIPTVNKEVLASYGIDSSNLKFRDNVRLEPTGLKGQNTYFLTYYNAKDNIIFRLRGEDNQPIVIAPNSAAKKYDAFLVERNLQDTLKKRAGEGAPAMGGYYEMTQPSQQEIDQIIKDPLREFNYDLQDVKPSESFDAWMGRNTAKLSTQSKSYAEFAVSKLQEYGIGNLQKAAIKILGFESGGFNPNAKNPVSSARGIGQMTDDTWAIYGKGLDRNNPQDQIDASIRYMKDINTSFVRNFDRQPTDSELYVMYQQGASGGTALMKFPNMKAIDVLTTVYQGNRAKAISAIQNNLKGSTKYTIGRMTAGQFTKIIGSYVGD